MIDAGRPAAEYGIGEGMALADRDRGQVDPVGDIADRVDVGHARARIVVDHDGAARRDRDPGRLEAEASDVGRTPEREHHLVDVDPALVGEFRRTGVAGRARPPQPCGR